MTRYAFSAVRIHCMVTNLPAQDSDAPSRNRRGLGAPALAGAGGVNAGGSALLPGDLAAAAGAPSNFGKVGDASLADADPLGVNQNVTFDEVGGLDNRKRLSSVI